MSVKIEEILFPQTLIPTEYPDQAVVTDVRIEQGISFGPFPGSDKELHNWMKYVTSVEKYSESNLIIGFLHGELYYHTRRTVTPGTELIVWGGKKKLYLLDPSEWTDYESNTMIFPCQDCEEIFQGIYDLRCHWFTTHQSIEDKQLTKEGQCPFCPFKVSYSQNMWKHILKHGINIKSEEVNTYKRKLYEKYKKKGSKKKNNASKIRSDKSGLGGIKGKYNCRHCAQKFDQWPQLYQHLREHRKKLKEVKVKNKNDENEAGTSQTLVTSHSCKYCGKLFNLNRQLSGHLATCMKKNGISESKVKKPQCKHCGKKFSCSANVARHIRNIHLKRRCF